MTACLLLWGFLVGCGPEESRRWGPEREAWAGIAEVRAETPRDAAAVPSDLWVGEDKARHFALSFAATTMAYGGARLVVEPGPGRRAAAGAALLLGIAKELVDVRGGGPFSLKDLAWDAAGVALGYTLAQQIR